MGWFPEGRVCWRIHHPEGSPVDRCANPAAATAAPKPSAAASSSHSALGVEQTPLAVTGTRKAKVLYDYDAHDASELSLLADELITVYTVPGMDPDWLVGERGNDKGKVPVTYLELLS
ncbi:unnamed protein product [Tetraodon nigroviridis]|uniref:(spotted green pufferfish) hypothetical protein n=1 Tax=Tetraodon nigroviridis TaxID=99883 RepID=Q4TJA0_TETNG|nr:unnamed protein product [Tetraodon nigroviridis]